VCERERERENKVKVKFTLELAFTAQKENSGVALLLFDLGARWGGWSAPRPGRFTTRKDAVSLM
jgi:hypothetical protein